VIFVDLDAFKAVNDRLGHVAGDRVLQIVADRLAAAAPPAFVGRLGGDEFLAIVDGDDAAIRAARLADVLTSTLETPIVLHGEEIVPVHATCGVARCRPGDTAEDLIAAADAAMYHAKDTANRH
jgi:diguanylate cyclase (GGDEF)-like protein